MWTRRLARWYATSGRHDLAWRATAEPWAILVSEVMLQQTQVARVAGRWESFLARWPTPEACSTSPLAEVLREWQGLGYPRRARSLHDTARIVTTHGWPDSESGLRSLPGVGAYTARALMVLAFGDEGAPPHDVNIARITARAALGQERTEVKAGDIDHALLTGRPRNMSARAFTYALFDAGALHCRAQPRCEGCPLATVCASRSRVAAGTALQRGRSPRYRGSTRELRGAVLRAMLADPPPATMDDLLLRAGDAARGRDRSEIAAALDGLVRERLVGATLLLGSIR